MSSMTSGNTAEPQTGRGGDLILLATWAESEHTFLLKIIPFSELPHQHNELLTPSEPKTKLNLQAKPRKFMSCPWKAYAQLSRVKGRPSLPSHPPPGAILALKPRRDAVKRGEHLGAAVSTSLSPGAKEKGQELPLQTPAYGSELQSVCKEKYFSFCTNGALYFNADFLLEEKAR